MKIVKLSGNDCGGFKKPKGHLDTQMFPECEGTETDRNIVKKTEERRKKKKAEDTIDHIEVEAKKKKKWNPNPWAICTDSCGREDKEKYERCVQDVKKKQAFNLKEYKTAEKEEHIEKGKFTEYCKRNGFEGPCKECAEHAMKSNSTSAHKMSTFYTNTVKP